MLMPMPMMPMPMMPMLLTVNDKQDAAAAAAAAVLSASLLLLLPSNPLSLPLALSLELRYCKQNMKHES